MLRCAVLCCGAARTCSSAALTKSTQWSVMAASCSSASFFSLSVRCLPSHTSFSRSTSCLPRVLIAFVSLGTVASTLMLFCFQALFCG